MIHQTVAPVEKGKSIVLKQMQILAVNDIKDSATGYVNCRVS